MAIEEAIHRIQNHMDVHHIGKYPHIHIKEALDLAIAALQAQNERHQIAAMERLPEQGQEQTNADLLRAMSDDELAAFLADDDRACPAVHSRCGKHVTFCVGCWLEWLQLPAEV